MPAAGIVSLVITYGPKVVGILMAVITAVQAVSGSDPNCTGNCEIMSMAKAALWAVLGFVVKPINMTGGTVANPTSAVGTLPPHELTPVTPIVDPKAPTVPVEVKK